MALKLVGGLYLLYLAAVIWRGAKSPIEVSGREGLLPNSAMKSFLLALFTQVSNPKAVVVYGSIFAALLPQDMPMIAIMALPPLVFLVEAGWYAILAMVLSSRSSTAVYLNAKAVIDRTASLIMGGLGLKLIADAR